MELGIIHENLIGIMSEVQKVKKEVFKLSAVKSLDNMVNDSDALLASLEDLKSDIEKDNDINFDEVKRSVDEWDKNSLQNEKRIHRALRNYTSKIEEIPTENVEPICESVGIDRKLQKTTIDQVIAEDLLYKGEFKISEQLCRDKDEEKFANTEKQFKRLAFLTDEIQKNSNINPAIEWAEENLTELTRIGSDLPFRLQVAAFLTLLCTGNRDKYKALQYAQKNFPEYTNSNLEAVLDTFSLIIRPDIESSKLEKMAESMNVYIIEKLRNDFCAIIAKPEQSPLYSSVAAGYIAIPALKKYQAISQMTGKLKWTESDELPVAVQLPKWLRFHPTYICPISKREIGKNGEEAIVLDCGHIISCTAYRNLLGSRSDGSAVKCPYCPKLSYNACEGVFVNI